MDKRERTLRKAVNEECEKLGCRMVSIERTGGGHFRIRAEGNGRTANVIAAFSPRTPFYLTTTRAEIRRQLTGDDNAPQ